MWRASVVSMITKRRRVHQSDHNVQEWESSFTSVLNAAKNTHHIKKGFNKSCLELNFVQKSLRARMSIPSQSGAMGEIGICAHRLSRMKFNSE